MLAGAAVALGPEVAEKREPARPVAGELVIADAGE